MPTPGTTIADALANKPKGQTYNLLRDEYRTPGPDIKGEVSSFFRKLFGLQPKAKPEDRDRADDMADVYIGAGGNMQGLQRAQANMSKVPVYAQGDDGGQAYRPQAAGPGKQETEQEYWIRVAKEAAQEQVNTKNRLASEAAKAATNKQENRHDYNYDRTHPSGPGTPAETIAKLKKKYGIDDKYNDIPLGGSPVPEVEKEPSLLD